LPARRRAWLESAPVATPATLAPPPSWPPAGGRRVVFLLDASSPLERRLLERWIERARPAGTAPAAYDVVAIPPSRRRRRAGRVDVAHTAGLPDFVARQAALALERAERRLRGARYKVPRFVEQEIVARPAFRGGIARLARRLGRDEASVTRDAQRYLRE